MNNILEKFESPQLQKIHAGKVRDSIRINEKRRMIVVTDRISAFNKNLKNSAIPSKGGVLNSLTNFWFDQTEHIIKNHKIEQIDDNITLVREAEPIRVEMIVRAYLTGSMWRGYQSGQREFSGVNVDDGLSYNAKFKSPILTPTTKDAFDTEITENEIIRLGLVDEATYQKMKDAALKLFAFGSDYLTQRGIILVDTKYEFGICDGELILIDEIHTPDSSRFWNKADYEKAPEKAEQIDKEFVRQWMLNNKVKGQVPDILPKEIIDETSKRYKDIFMIITGREYHQPDEYIKTRMYRLLVSKGIIKPGYIAMVMGSKADQAHAEKIKSFLEKFELTIEMRVISAHKNGERIIEIADTLNHCIDPVAVIAIAGLSNGLGGALAANLSVPVINCPPFKDNTEILLNINSSLMMPSATPALTVIRPDNAALAAVRALNIALFKDQLNKDIYELKETLIKDDNDLKN